MSAIYSLTVYSHLHTQPERVRQKDKSKIKQKQGPVNL